MTSPQTQEAWTDPNFDQVTGALAELHMRAEERGLHGWCQCLPGKPFSTIGASSSLSKAAWVAPSGGIK